MFHVVTLPTFNDLRLFLFLNCTSLEDKLCPINLRIFHHVKYSLICNTGNEPHENKNILPLHNTTTHKKHEEIKKKEKRREAQDQDVKLYSCTGDVFLSFFFFEELETFKFYKSEITEMEKPIPQDF